MPSTTFIAWLTCGHGNLFNPIPRVGNILYCQQCRKYGKCLSVDKAYRVVCRGCTLSLSYGVDLPRVRRAGVRHLRKNPAHTVSIYAGEDWVEDVSMGQQEIPGIVTNP